MTKMSVFDLSVAGAAAALLMIFFVGACFGSFINCAVIRLTKRTGSLWGRSECPECGHALGAADLIPILSWVFLRGKCRYCRKKISARYPLTELLCGAGFSGIAAARGLSLTALEYAAAFSIIFAGALCDIDTLCVPNGIHLALAAVYLIFLPAQPDPLKCLLNGVFGFLIYGAGLLIFSLIADRILGRPSLGGADIKLFAVLGLYFGPAGTLMVLIISCAAGLLGAAITKKGFGREFPFLPYIAFAAWAGMLFADRFAERYLGLFSA